MVKVNRWLGCLVMAIGAGGSVAAGPGASAASAAGSPVVKHLASQGVRITDEFAAASGLRAVVADNGKERRLFYVTADGNTLIAGQLFDSKGSNLTSLDMRKTGIQDQAPGQAKPLGEPELKALWKRVEGLRAVSEGAGGKTVYVFFDPNCPYCHRLWSALSSAVKDGKLQVRWLPVAILKDDSKGLGAAIYAAADPSSALSRMASRTLAPAAVTDKVNRDIALNLLALRDTGFTGVPLLMFKRGDRVEMISGVPAESQLNAWRSGVDG